MNTKKQNHNPATPWLWIILSAIVLMTFFPAMLHASDAWVYLEGRRNPMYIQDIKFEYPKQNRKIKQAIILIKGQRKYHSYNFYEIREINFRKLSGVQRRYPVYNVHITLRTPSHRIDTLLMPLKEVSGNYMGRQWNMNLKLKEADMLDRDALKIDRIVFKAAP